MDFPLKEWEDLMMILMDFNWKEWEASMMILVRRFISAIRDASKALVLLLGSSNICARSMNAAIQDFIQYVEGDIIFTCQQLNDLATFQTCDPDNGLRAIPVFYTIQHTISGSARQSDNPEIRNLLNFMCLKFIEVFRCIDVILKGIRAGRFSPSIARQIMDRMQVFLVQSILGPAARIQDMTSSVEVIEPLTTSMDHVPIPTSMFTYSNSQLERLWLEGES